MAKRPSKAVPSFALNEPRLAPLGDVPPSFSEGHKDHFDLSLRIGAIYDILRHKDTPTPLTIAIYGDWGSGKTTAMRWLESNLRYWNEKGPKGRIKTVPVWFAPWKYLNQEDVWRGLIGQVIVACLTKEADVKTIYEDMKDFSAFLGRSFVSLLSGLKFTAGISKEIKAQFDGARIKELQEHAETYFNPQNAYTNQFEHALNQWVDRYARKQGERIVIFIDDLDRCLPEISLKVLEALKLYLDIPGLVFVIGVDRQVVDQLVQKHYENHGLGADKSRFYLAKMFAIEVEVGPSDVQVETYLGALLENNQQWEEFAEQEQEVFLGIMNHLAARSPRETRRLVDSALIRGASVRIHAEERQGEVELTAAQGVQIYLAERILAQPKYNRTSMLRQKRGNAFFQEWSGFTTDLRKEEAVTLPIDLIHRLQPPGENETTKTDAGTRLVRPEIEADVINDLPMAFQKIVARPEYRPYLELLGDRQLGQLIRLGWPEDASSFSQSESMGAADIVREAIARALGVSIEHLSETSFDNVDELDLSGSDIEDLLPLKNLTKLSGLYLNDTQVSDLAPLKALINLSGLGLSSTQVSDLMPLKGLTNLSGLGLNDTQVSNLTPLKDLTKLSTLYLDHTRVSDLAPLEGLTNLSGLGLNDTQVSDLAPLKGLTNLIGLYLDGTKVSDLEPLKGLTNLRELYLAGTKVSEDQRRKLQKKLPNLRIFAE